MKLQNNVSLQKKWIMRSIVLFKFVKHSIKYALVTYVSVSGF